jgi:hypothetical protein
MEGGLMRLMMDDDFGSSQVTQVAPGQRFLGRRIIESGMRRLFSIY